MDRRTFLGSVALGAAVSALGPYQPSEASRLGRVIFSLPKIDTPRFAWTVDDGASEKTVAGYIRLLKENPNLKITFFVTSAYATWRRHESSLNDLLSTGQIQLANHTFSHKDLTSVSNQKIRQELLACKRFLEDHFGTTGEPFYRPPYGSYNSNVREVAADLGYTNTVMWYGTLADAGQNTQRGLLRNARRWMNDRAILISHANHPQIIDDFERMLALIEARHLKTVTLTEVFG
ncbi:MAG: polysaccharide deacetylase family protein [Micrococcales bacterium]